ncbi:mannose-1-phosphate guanylyltransferase/mannose-6-phosphate isomerase [Variovorax sp. PAMC 28711]|uniref:mannose-1-phosphate guanylyltransferase/mannose-6-phosphate isomerase n=1 Tax=Variovorax sp. PAMC 28711 TaxID=1795631 RepID=UPI00078D22AD|nr:mannose-1-phosphate guanylyltransferase/mannose-6-phosphate isomerase [Variovorax sp. PAMC 28711]AMM25523.1 mannose-1-phosphate guanylyltransferase/mannose-6-phosphate isomerase [Variovorax sp. PAMC 28711]
MNPTIQPVVLCGGAGTRLWPLSRRALPKQFAPLLAGKSLLQLTLERLRLLNPTVHCVAAEEHRFLVQETVIAAGVDGLQLLEPVPRNTAAAMAIAALISAPDQLLLFAPADHHIPDASRFAETVRTGIPAAMAGNIVTYGVVPSFPSTAYGYIRQGAALDLPGESPASHVDAFVEKPNAADAATLLLSGNHFWNAGIFLVEARTLIAMLEEHAPDILSACRRATEPTERDGNFVRVQRAAFENCRSQSIDYAVLEQCTRRAVVPFGGAWSDVGSWNAVAALHAEDASGNRINGQGFSIGARDTFIHAPTRPVVALGTQDLLIIDTQDALLVAHKDCAEQVKEVVSLLMTRGQREATEHRRVPRPWGAYDSVDDGERFSVKRLTVKPGAKLALRMHRHRAEHWVVVQGTARVTRDGVAETVRENESIYIPIGAIYQLENPGDSVLEVIEVQTGRHLGEDDVVRFDDAPTPHLDAAMQKQA